MRAYIFTYIAVLSLGSCGSTRYQKPIADNNPPFEVLAATVTPWAAGVRNGGSGVNIELQLNRPYNKLLFVYYQGQKANINYKDADVKKVIYRAYVKTDATTNKELTLHQDPKREYGNTPPLFNLKKTELAVVYSKKNKTYYKIVPRVERKPPLNYM